MRISLVDFGLVAFIAICWSLLGCTQTGSAAHPVPREHPRLLGSREDLQKLAEQRPQAYERMARVARDMDAGAHEKIISMSLVNVIEGDPTLARAAVELALEAVNAPIRVGHVTFGHDLARCAIAYDLCYDAWTDAERAAFIKYVDATVDANVNSETHVFHNGWYGYKNWGIGLAAYACYYDNPRARDFLATLYDDYYSRAAPALKLAGAGGGWAEGYYIHYFIYEWLFFCEVARHCEGADLYEAAPEFYRQRAIAGAFEMYPGIRQYGSRRPVPMGDGGGITFGGDRDKELSSRRILVNRYRDDLAHQDVHTFNETTPRSGVGVYAYKDFLWRDDTVPTTDLDDFKLSHISTGPGFVYARSSWGEDATYFFFKCGDRFTAHQHLDVGHFMIYRREELVGDGGYYADWTSPHIVNYHVRSIAHSTMLVHNPDEKWAAIRGAETNGNDGGQWFPWPHHNGAVIDAQAWEEGKDMYDIGDILAFEDHGDLLYISSDCTKAYDPAKLASWTRQIVYIRPGTFVILDRVEATRPEFKKTWVLQALKPPTGDAPDLVITNGEGRLFVQTLLPPGAQTDLFSGDDLYAYSHGGPAYRPLREPPGPIPECRIEVSPAENTTVTHFLHVLTATDATEDSVPQATVQQADGLITVTVGDTKLLLNSDTPGGSAQHAGTTYQLTQRIVQTPVR